MSPSHVGAGISYPNNGFSFSRVSRSEIWVLQVVAAKGEGLHSETSSYSDNWGVGVTWRVRPSGLQACILRDFEHVKPN